MANRTGDTQQAQPDRQEHLQRAYVRLATALQSVDLEQEESLGDEVIEAVQATNRAYELDQTADQ